MLESCKIFKKGHIAMKCAHCYKRRMTENKLRKIRNWAIVVMFIILFFMLVENAQGETVEVTASVECNNQNLTTSPICNVPPAEFTVDEDGEAYGTLESGVPFSQTNVSNDLGVRLQKFTLQQAFWYVSDRQTIYAPNDITALSIYLTL